MLNMSVLSKRIAAIVLCTVLCFALCSCGSNTKTGTDGLEYEAYDGSYIVTGYHGSDVHVVIPDTCNGIPVTEIEEYAFEESEIQSVHIGANITHVGAGAFSDASLLKEAYISASVEVLDGSDVRDGVFEGCVSLEKVTIENGSALWRIGYGTFLGCDSLKEITLPDGLQKIGNLAFSSCKSLEQLVIPAAVDYVGGSAFANFTADQEIVILGSTEGWQIEESQFNRRSWKNGCDAQIIYE